MTEAWKLKPLKDSYNYDYDERVSPSVGNEFAAAAFRMLHSMVQVFSISPSTKAHSHLYWKGIKLLSYFLNSYPAVFNFC